MSPEKKTLALSVQSQLVHQGLDRSGFGETAEALYMTSGYVYDSAEQAEARFKGEDEGYIYSRYGNPTVSLFENRLAALEGTDVCVALSSGMAAMHAALACQLRAGDHIVASRALFGSCLQVITNLLPRYGVSFTLIDGGDLDAWEAAIKPNTKVFFCETPANPTLALVDIEAVGKIAKAAGLCFIVDNAFASPVVQRAAPLGADVVTYSATKHIDGQGRCMGGAVCCSQEFYDEHLQFYIRHTGPSLSPFNAWNLAKALETLDLRVSRMADNALAVAEFLSDHPNILRVNYPGLESHEHHDIAKKQMLNGGTLVAFQIKGGKANAFKTLNALQMIKISNNLGDSKSLITHPATTTHRVLSEEERWEIGITNCMVRLSLGLEKSNDLIADLDNALLSVDAP
ncbi:MAG: O-succinylhomoserine sulfhydrylase [Alphaproteobacteria bacterium]